MWTSKLVSSASRLLRTRNIRKFHPHRRFTISILFHRNHHKCLLSPSLNHSASMTHSIRTISFPHYSPHRQITTPTHKKPDPKHRVYRKARIPSETNRWLEALLLALMFGICGIPCYFLYNFYDGVVPITHRKRVLFLPMWLDQLVGRYTLQTLGIGSEDTDDDGQTTGGLLSRSDDHRVAHIEDIFDRIIICNHLKSLESLEPLNEGIESEQSQMRYNQFNEFLDQNQKNANSPLLKELKRFQCFEWKLSVVDQSGVINAMCVPGGKMIVFTGILKEVVSSDDECAAILCHEIGHALCRHGMEAMQWRLMWIAAIYVTVSMMGIDLSWLVDRLLYLGVNMLLQLPMSRRAELEADEIAIYLMDQSGYDLDALVSVMEKLGNVEDRLGKVPEVISTHPLTDNRISILKEKIAAKRDRENEK